MAKRREIEPGIFTMSIEDYIPLFKRLGVAAVIRFNKKCYDRRRFLEAGINHYDMYYEDGGNPTEAILQRFLAVCEREKGAIAVHCKAGLGRTGTNIAAFMMRHYGYTSLEAMAWLRICRPGSVVGYVKLQFVLLFLLAASAMLSGESKLAIKARSSNFAVMCKLNFGKKARYYASVLGVWNR
jgi:protein-tyrosine phosphatase